jgi:hypothetical protein
MIRKFQPYGGDYYVNGFPAFVGELALSPDGNKIAYDMIYENTDNATHREIVVMDLTMHKTTRLTYTSSTTRFIRRGRPTAPCSPSSATGRASGRSTP